MKKILLITGLALALATAARAATDNASNYGGSWPNGSNGGTGFTTWSFASNNGGASFAGSFIASSTAGAGNINTSGVSFGLYANPTSAFMDASRAFALALTTGDVFTFQLAVNYDNGNKGFNLFAGSQAEVFNFNIGGGASVSSSNATLNPGTGLGYNYGGNNTVINVTVAVTSSTQFSYDISRTSEAGFQGTLFSGTVSGLTQSLTGFKFYVAGTDSGADQNNLYINNLSVIPEPSAAALLVAGLGAFAFLHTRKPRRKT